MRVKLDENLPAALVAALVDLGHDVDSVPMEGLGGAPDGAVWAAAQEKGRFFVTQDLDFSDIRRFQPGKHHGILLVRLRDPGRKALLRRICTFFQSEEAPAASRCFVTLTERKVRVRRPG